MADEQDQQNQPHKIDFKPVEQVDENAIYKPSAPETEEEKTDRLVMQTYNEVTGGDLPSKYVPIIVGLVVIIVIVAIVAAIFLFKDVVRL